MKYGNLLADKLGHTDRLIRERREANDAVRYREKAPPPLPLANDINYLEAGIPSEHAGVREKQRL